GLEFFHTTFSCCLIFYSALVTRYSLLIIGGTCHNWSGPPRYGRDTLSSTDARGRAGRPGVANPCGRRTGAGAGTAPADGGPRHPTPQTRVFPATSGACDPHARGR